MKVVSERRGHAKPAFTIETNENVLPGMEADAPAIFQRLVASDVLPIAKSTVEDPAERPRTSA